ncbi:hypothetical protein ACMA1I_00710 [Pontibacter sp. 13R65]|uniref:hypothetical protein n=1 Tax=Pontibacter sp. 13R65 TaxID=3127458 RepID=UPI00301E0790
MPQIVNGKVPVTLNGAGALKEVALVKEKASADALPIYSANFIKYLLLVAGILLVLHLLVVLVILAGDEYNFLPTWQGKFYFAKKGNLPSFFSSFILLLSSCLLALIAAIKRKAKDYFATHWAGLALIFIAMAVDEAVGIHELLLARFSPADERYLVWGVASGVFVLLFAVFYYQFYKSLNLAARRGFFTAGFCFLLGAIGFEMLGASLLNQGYNDRSLLFMAVMTTEEVLEMGSILFFVNVLFNYLKPYATFGFVVK